MAHFYENEKDRQTSWEDVGGLNTLLLAEMRSAVLTVDEEESSLPSVPGGANAAVSWWIRRIPAYDFPDDEIG